MMAKIILIPRVPVYFFFNLVSWLFMAKGVTYWKSPDLNYSIYLIGNPVVWWLGSFSIMVFLMYTVIDTFAQQRGIDIAQPGFYKSILSGLAYFTLAWTTHFVPYIFSSEPVLIKLI